VFGIYYAPYVYMFTASALRNMDPSLEEAAEVSGASAFAPVHRDVPADHAGDRLRHAAVVHRDARHLRHPGGARRAGQHPVLTTYIFKLTNWSPPLYNTAAAVAIILMVVTGFLVFCSRRC
jgi:iron(III) transport system permease protein